MPTGVLAVDAIIGGGLQVGAITEIVGAECSGRTGLSLSFLAQLTRVGKVCAWVDVSNALHPESAAAAGVDLSRLLWVRCGVQPFTNTQSTDNNFALPEEYLIPPPIKKGLHGGGYGPHPRTEVRGLSDAVSSFLTAPRCAEPQRRVKIEREVFEPKAQQKPISNKAPRACGKPWSRIEQGLRVTDLLLQAGGFSAIVLDMGSIAPEYASRVPLATWFRYRATAERTQTSIVLLTQYLCAKSSAGLSLQLQAGNALREVSTVFTGVEHRVDVTRERFKTAPDNVVFLRKSPQRETTAGWKSQPSWAAPR
jgi:hypothetical protein